MNVNVLAQQAALRSSPAHSQFGWSFDVGRPMGFKQLGPATNSLRREIPPAGFQSRYPPSQNSPESEPHFLLNAYDWRKLAGERLQTRSAFDNSLLRLAEGDVFPRKIDALTTIGRDEGGWRLIEGLIGSIRAPADLSSEHDRYLYGSPRPRDEC